MFERAIGKPLFPIGRMPWFPTLGPTKEGSASGGAAIYAQLCAACHGVARKGCPAQNVPDLSNVGQRLKKSDVVALLGAGKGVMPSFALPE